MLMTILKVAAGVFIGIVAVLALMAIPGWMRESAISQARASIGPFTPDAIIAHCGKPIKDDASTDEHQMSYRTLLYQAKGIPQYPDMLAILDFIKAGPSADWTISHMKVVPKMSNVDLGTLLLASANLDDVVDPREQIQSLPCLAQK